VTAVGFGNLNTYKEQQRAAYGGLSPVMAQQVNGLIQASQGKLRLVSGYRTLAEQEALYAEAVRRYGEQNAAAWVADPAHSNHVKGSAADIAGDQSVLRQLAPQFGLVAPMSWEPWHVELSSTPQHAHPLAYTTPPPGEQNPAGADRSTSPTHVAAMLAESLIGANGNGTNMDTLATPAAQGELSDILSGTPVQGQPSQAVQGAGQAAATTAGGANYSGKGNVNPKQLYGALVSEGLPPEAAAAFVSIAGRESGYNTGAYNGNRSTGDDSVGLFQINLLNGGWGPFLEAHGMSDPRSALATFQGSVQAAKWIYESSGLHPWGGYKGMPWWYSTNLQAGADASGGAVTPQMMEALGGG